MPLVFGNAHPDSDYAYFSREEVRGREAYMRELRETVTLLYNTPSIAMWVPFNEGWGQFDALQAVEAIRELDETRTIDHASGWHDQRRRRREEPACVLQTVSFFKGRLPRARSY